MIAYRKDWLDAHNIKVNAFKWYEKGLISNESLSNIKEQNPSDFYSPVMFVCIGLSIFTWIGICAAVGLLALPFMRGNEYSFFAFICGIILVFALEHFIRVKKHFGSGIDDMLLYAAIIAFLMAFSEWIPMGYSQLGFYFAAFPLLLLGSIRYLDRLLTLATACCGFMIIALIVKDIPTYATALMPFVGMVYGGLFYYFSQKMQQQHQFRFWKNNLLTTETFGLILFYISGNYFVVQSVGKELFGLESMPIPWFFWLFTFLVPVLYVYSGLQRKNRLLLTLGLAGLVAAIATFRNYHNVMPLAWAALIGGVVLFLIAYFSIQYLKKNNLVYTFAADDDETMLMRIQEQALYHSMGNLPQTPQGKGADFGGGQFGGGGAGGDF
jgi:hypothetical protein